MLCRRSTGCAGARRYRPMAVHLAICTTATGTRRRWAISPCCTTISATACATTSGEQAIGVAVTVGGAGEGAGQYPQSRTTCSASSAEDLHTNRQGGGQKKAESPGPAITEASVTAPGGRSCCNAFDTGLRAASLQFLPGRRPAASCASLTAARRAGRRSVWACWTRRRRRNPLAARSLRPAVGLLFRPRPRAQPRGRSLSGMQQCDTQSHTNRCQQRPPAHIRLRARFAPARRRGPPRRQQPGLQPQQKALSALPSSSPTGSRAPMPAARRSHHLGSTHTCLDGGCPHSTSLQLPAVRTAGDAAQRRQQHPSGSLCPGSRRGETPPPPPHPLATSSPHTTAPALAQGAHHHPA